MAGPRGVAGHDACRRRRTARRSDGFGRAGRSRHSRLGRRPGHRPPVRHRPGHQQRLPRAPHTIRPRWHRGYVRARRADRRGRIGVGPHRRDERTRPRLARSVTGQTGAMDPVVALRQIAYYKDRAREDSRRVMAYRNAADVVETLTDAQRDRHGAANSWQSLPGIGPKTAKVIAQAWAGAEPDVLTELREAVADLG